MSSAHCRQCGAMSTIWLPTCVFCGQPVSASSARIKPVSRIRRAVFDDPAAPCTERRKVAPKPGFLESMRLLWSRMVQRLAA